MIEDKKDLTNRSVWSKTTLITSSVGVHPPSCKMGNTFGFKINIDRIHSSVDVVIVTTFLSDLTHFFLLLH